MYKCVKDRLFEYLAQYPVDNYGWSYVPPDQVVRDTGISREELWFIIQNTKRQAFLDIMTTNVPSPDGLSALGISQRGRLWLNGEDYSQIPEGREKVYNLL